MGSWRGDAAAAYLYNCPKYVAIFFGARQTRVMPADIIYRYSSDEWLAWVNNAEAKVLFFDASSRDRVASIVDRAPGLLLAEVGGSGAPADSRCLHLRRRGNSGHLGTGSADVARR